MHTSVATRPSHDASPDVLRVRAVTRRISLPPSVAALVAELCFGHLDRDHVSVAPVSRTEVRP